MYCFLLLYSYYSDKINFLINNLNTYKYYNVFLKTKHSELDVKEMIGKFELLNWIKYEEIKRQNNKNCLDFEILTKKILNSKIIVDELTELLFL